MTKISMRNLTKKMKSNLQIPRLGVGLLLIKEGRLLLGKRKSAIGQGTWAIPGGHLEFGETIEECATRELLEETGLIAKELERGPCVDYITSPHHFVSIFVKVKTFEGELTLKEPDKCEGWEWCDIQNLPAPLFYPLQIYLNEYKAEFMLT